MSGADKTRKTETERMEALLRGERPDRVPIWPFGYHGFAGRNIGYSKPDGYNNPKRALASQMACCEQYGWVFTPLLMYGGWGSWEFGGEIRWPKDEFDMSPIINRYPVESVEQAMSLELSNLYEAGMVPMQTDFIELAVKKRREEKPFNILLPFGGPFTIASNICSAERLCRWAIKRPDLAHRLIGLANDASLSLFQHWKTLFGTEGFMPFIGEPAASNQLISPSQFEEFAFPYLLELHEKILEMGYKHIFCHICGEANANLPFWAKIPMGDHGVVSIGHEVDILKASEFFPNDVIVGNLEPTLLQTAEPEKVYQASVSIIERGKGCAGGFAFSPGCEMPPMAPSHNIWMMTKAANDVGWHDG